MKPSHIPARVQDIRAHAHEPAVAHTLEAQLFRDVLRAIAAGKPQPVKLAREALKANQIEFDRLGVLTTKAARPANSNTLVRLSPNCRADLGARVLVGRYGVIRLRRGEQRLLFDGFLNPYSPNSVVSWEKLALALRINPAETKKAKNNLAVVVARLRRKLADSAPKLVSTVRGGYFLKVD
jgi:hypothetical protein